MKQPRNLRDLDCQGEFEDDYAEDRYPGCVCSYCAPDLDLEDDAEQMAEEYAKDLDNHMAYIKDEKPMDESTSWEEYVSDAADDVGDYLEHGLSPETGALCTTFLYGVSAICAAIMSKN